MQTFMPLPDLRKSLISLDSVRLANQKRETITILRTLERVKRGIRDGTGWYYHPATQMWEGFENALRLYLNLNLEVAADRGITNNVGPIEILDEVVMPWWFGEEEFHRSHRSNLLRKLPEWYGQFGWTEPKDLPYVWPVRSVNKETLFYDFKLRTYQRIL